MGLAVASAAASSLIVGVGAITVYLLPLDFPASSSNARDTMPTAAFSWDVQRVFPVPGRSDVRIMGRAFDLLPGGTMINAPCIHRGVVGVTVKMLSATKAEIVNSEPVIMTRGETTPDDLVPWQEELLETFQAQRA
jgi:hypothetical protein